MRRTFFAILLIIVGGGVLVNGLSHFLSHSTPNAQPWYWYHAGLLMSLAGIWFWPTSILPTTHCPTDQHPYWIMLGIVALALGLRFIQLNYSDGVWGDEAEAALSARQLLQESTYRPIYNPNIHITWPQMWLYAGTLQIFGDNNIWPLRLVSIAFGIGSVWLGYWVGWQWHGRSMGLAMAFFLAVMRWSLVFSQLAITGIEAVFFTLLLLHSLKRLSNRPTLHNAFYVGIALGGGLLFYMAFRIVAVGLILMFLLHTPAWKLSLQRLALASWVALLMVLPLVTYAWQFPEDFWRRNQDLVIGQEVPTVYPSFAQTLAVSISRYLGMFHLRGDGREIYNYRQVPMLDPFIGLLLVIGLGTLLVTWRKAASQTFLVLFGIGLLPGILTITADAPHSGRSIAVLPAVAYCCGIAGLWLHNQAMQYYGVSTRQWCAVGGILGVMITGWNVASYHVGQLHDFETWYRTARPRLIVNAVQESGYADSQWLISNRLYPVRPVEFLDPELHLEGRESVDFIPTGPLAPEQQQLILDGRDTWAAEYLAYLFPEAAITPFNFSPYSLTHLRHGFIPFYQIVIPSSAIEAFNHRLEADSTLLSSYGWQGYYYPNLALAGPPTLERLTPSLFQYFHVRPFDADPYSVQWLGCLTIPEAREYTFLLTAIGKAELYLDDQWQLSHSTSHEEIRLRGKRPERQLTLALEAGIIPIELRYWDDQEPYADLYLSWDGTQQELLAPFSPLAVTPRSLGADCPAP